ncbi:hypothetical protein RJT34_03488 [Clitoria ternatea]|uniref:Uncharacterized protein n=1 Tax=Clitoria ternatea TaxID=43366 RepID=A0AAN9KKV1_CLITE
MKPPNIRVSFKDNVLGRPSGDPQQATNLITTGVMPSIMCPEASLANQEPEAPMGTESTSKNPEVTRYPEVSDTIAESTMPETTHGDWIIARKTRKPKILQAESFWRKLGFEKMGLMEASRNSRGIWVLSKSMGTVQVNVVDTISQVVTVGINQGSQRWMCSAIYAKPRLHEHKVL